jgi:cellulase (glycosyl hydrolase family 5)
MKPRVVFRASLLALCFVCGCTSTRNAAAAPDREIHFSEIPIGLCEDYPKESRTLAAARNDLELLKTNNIHVLRISFSWLDMEPAAGKYDWSFWDDFVRMAVDEYKIRLIPYVCYTPRWASAATNETFWQQPPKNNGQFAEFMTQLVGRYKDRIHSWEIWNEPDNPYYWRGSTGQFAALLRAGANAVRQTDPTANIVMGGLAWNPEFLEAIVSDPAAISNVNVINLHNYYETWASEPLERIPEYVGRAADLLRHYHCRQSLWMAEVGYSDFRRGDFVSGQYFAYFANEHTPQAQAESLFRVLTLAMASGNISLIAWYRIHDLPAAQEVIGDENNRHLGVLDNRNQMKPALRSLFFFNSLFANGFRCVDDAVRVNKVIGAPAEVHAFLTPDGSLVIAAWLKTYVPGQRTSSLPSGAVVDHRTSTVHLEFPWAAKRAKVFNETGTRRGQASVARLNNKNFEISCVLKDGSVTVLQIR